MGFADKLKALTKKAEDGAATHKDQIHKAVLKAEEAADQRTGGQYHDQILKAGQKADDLVDGLKEPDANASPRSEAPPARPPKDPAR
jgi:DNA-binding protein H-NS